jgi:hypothetical protein
MPEQIKRNSWFAGGRLYACLRKSLADTTSPGSRTCRFCVSSSAELCIALSALELPQWLKAIFFFCFAVYSMRHVRCISGLEAHLLAAPAENIWGICIQAGGRNLRVRNLGRVRQFGKVTSDNPVIAWEHASSFNSASNPGGMDGLGLGCCGHHANSSTDRG